LLSLLLLGGCFSIPFIGKGKVDRSKIKPEKRDFPRNNVFVGYDKDDEPIVEMRLISQEVTPEKGLIVYTRLFPTENFKVRNIFRGLRSINYYPIERRFHRLELKMGRRDLKMKVVENLEVKNTKPVDANFEHTGVFRLLPDTIDMARLKFQDVKRWKKMPEDTLDAWYTAKQNYIRHVRQAEQRSSLVDSYRRRQRGGDTKVFIQYDSVFVTANNTYVYLEKKVDSDILFTVNAGDRFPYGVSDGEWVEIPIPDSLQESLKDYLDKRHEKAVQQLELQRRLARSRRGAAQAQQAEVDTTSRDTGYILDAMVQKSYGKALDWEMESMIEPVDVPLFAKVLRDREAARIARLDSIKQARLDSIARVRQVADSTAAADSARADSQATSAGTTRPSASAGSTGQAASGKKLAKPTAPAAVSQDTAESGQKNSPETNEPRKQPQAGSRAGPKTEEPDPKKPTGEQPKKPANEPGNLHQEAKGKDRASGDKDAGESDTSGDKSGPRTSGDNSKAGNP